MSVAFSVIERAVGHAGPVNIPEPVMPAPLAELLRESAARTAASGRPDHETLTVLRRSGVLGAAVPARYGGAGGNAAVLNRVVEQIARVNPSAAIIAFQHFAVTMRIVEWGTAAQQALLLPQLASGDILAASAWSEPGAGAAKKKVSTTAERLHPQRWLLNGAKSFTTSAGIADIYLVLAQTSDVDDPDSVYGSAGQSFFLVPAANPGLVPECPLDLIGMRGSATGFVSLKACEIGDDGRLGPEGHAAVIIAGVRETGVTLGAVAVGIARSLLDIAAAHVAKADQARLPTARYRLTELATQVAAAAALVAQAGRGTSPDPGLVTLQSKVFASAVAERVGSEVALMLGASGYVAEHGLNRLLADARAVAHMGPANDLCRDLMSASWG